MRGWTPGSRSCLHACLSTLKLDLPDLTLEVKLCVNSQSRCSDDDSSWMSAALAIAHSRPLFRLML